MSLAEIGATCLEMSMWSCSGQCDFEVLHSKIYFYGIVLIFKFRTLYVKKSTFHALRMDIRRFSIYIIIKKNFVYKWQKVFVYIS